MKPTVIEITFAHAVTRCGWHHSPEYGCRLDGEYDVEHELRAAVTFYGINDAPEVEWLDKAVVEDLGLTDDELEGAEEQAVEAACDVLRKRPEQDDEATLRGDHERDHRKDAAIWEGR